MQREGGKSRIGAEENETGERTRVSPEAWKINSNQVGNSMKKYLVSMAALMLLSSGAQAATYLLQSVTYANTFAPTPGRCVMHELRHCDGC